VVDTVDSDFDMDESEGEAEQEQLAEEEEKQIRIAERQASTGWKIRRSIVANTLNGASFLVFHPL
jgi:hypothetical protein